MKKALWSILLVTVVVSAGCVGDDGGDEDVDASSTNGTDSGSQLPGDVDGQVTTPGPDGGSDGNMSHEHLAHVHDYWEGRSRVLLADENVELQPWWVFQSVIGHKEAAAGGAYWVPAQGQIVYEGTGQVEVTASWDAATITGLSMAYRHANTREFTEFQPLVSGETLTIETTPAMTDLAHSGSSRWAMVFMAKGHGQVAVGDFHLTIEIVKVHDIMELPGHGDAWGGKDVLTLMDEDATSQSRAFHTQIADCVTDDCQGNEGFTLPEGSIVPIGTKVIEVILTPQGDAANPDWAYLNARKADGSYENGENLPSENPGEFRFYVPVENGAADSPYAEQSLWSFYAYFSQDTAGTPINCGGCVDREMQFHAVIKAWKEWNMPGADDEGDGDGL